MGNYKRSEELANFLKDRFSKAALERPRVSDVLLSHMDDFVATMQNKGTQAVIDQANRRIEGIHALDGKLGSNFNAVDDNLSDIKAMRKLDIEICAAVIEHLQPKPV